MDAPAGLARELLEALSARGVDVREAPAPVALDVPDERAALADAARAYTALRPAEARQALEALLARADTRGTSGLDAAGFTQALLLLALCAQATGDEAAADAALDRLLAANPDVAADPIAYPPPLRERLERRREAVAAWPLVTLELTTTPGARLELDGRALVAGQTRPRVAPGPHLVRATAAGHLPSGQRIDVRAEPTSLALPLTLDPGAALVAPGSPDDPPGEPLRSAARALASTLLVVDVRRGADGLVVRAQDLASSRHAELRVPAELTARALASRIVAALFSPTETPRVPPPRGPRLWPWLVAAGAVVVGGVVLGVALSAPDAPTGFVLVPVSP